MKELVKMDDTFSSEDSNSFQSELFQNKLLPYSDFIDEESEVNLLKIKKELSKAIILRDIKFGVCFWSSELAKYIKLYGYKFSKEDHISFITQLYGLLSIKNIEAHLIEKLMSIITLLLKKKHVLLPEKSFTLDWKVLYHLVDRLVYSNEISTNLLLVPRAVQANVKTFVRVCRKFFRNDVTVEMLDEWKPLFCPYDSEMMTASTYIELFLPTLCYDDEERNSSWRLWSDEFLVWLTSAKNGPRWERRFISLFARLAFHNIGYIDWSDYINPIFIRTLRSFHLPVGKLQLTTAVSNKLPIESVTRWMVYMFGSPSSSPIVIDNFKQLMKSVETYFHPANFGSWVNALLAFVHNFVGQFIQRVKRERNPSNPWLPLIPIEHQIKDREIEEVVSTLKPVVFMLLYNKSTYIQTLRTIMSLTALRPDLITPIIIEKMFIASDSLTEPLHYRACLHAISCVLPMSINRYTEIRKDVIPILFGCLPGLDPNDLPKTIATCKLIKSFAFVLPFVDCSKGVNGEIELSEEEKDICFSTTQFENFVAHFFDRLLCLIESLKQDSYNAYESQPMVQGDYAIRTLVTTVASAVLHQCSKEVRSSKLKMLFNYSITHLFEGKAAISSHMGLISSCASTDPALAYSLFLPYYCEQVISYCRSNPEISKDHKLDKQFMWDMRVLVFLMSVGTIELLQYKSILFEVIDEVLKLDVKEAYKVSGALLESLISSWMNMCVKDERNVNEPFDEETSKFAFKAWGKMMQPEEVVMKWHVPNEEEYEAIFEALSRFLDPILNQLQNFANADNIDSDMKFEKEKIKNQLTFCRHVIKAASDLLSFEDDIWTDHGFDSLVDFVPLQFTADQKLRDQAISQKKGRYPRVRIFNIIRSVLNKLQISREDDVDSILLIIQIYKILRVPFDNISRCYNEAAEFYEYFKSCVSDPFLPKKSRVRQIHIQRASLHHQFRLTQNNKIGYTNFMHQIALDLIHLSVSKYARVRANAQSNFFLIVSNSPPYLHESLLPIVLSYLDPNNKPTHKQHKGALYLLLGKSESPFFANFSLCWSVINKVWPAVLKAPFSDKPSIQILTTKLMKKLSSYFITITIDSKVPDASIEISSNYLQNQMGFSSQDIRSLNEEGQKHEETNNHKRSVLYKSLMQELIELRTSNKLTWKMNEAALSMLSHLIRDDQDHSPPNLIKTFVSALCDEMMVVREQATSSFSQLLQKMKRKHLVLYKTPNQLAQIASGEPITNSWLIYKDDNKPDTKEKYESMIFIDKPHIGYYTWPKQLKTYQEFSKQPSLYRDYDQLSAGEKVVYDHFTDPKFVNNLMKYSSLEREQQKNSFNYKKFGLYRGLFRNFGNMFLPTFKPHIERMVQEKGEHYLRCAAELIAGLVAGSKHWPFDMVASLREWLLPQLRVAISNISTETTKDWNECFQLMVRNRDPRRVFWVIDFVTNELKYPSASALIFSTKFMLVQRVLIEQQWKVPGCLRDVVMFVEGQLDHNYKNIRSKIGSVLSTAFFHDLHYQGQLSKVHQNPSMNQLIEKILMRIAPLLIDDMSSSDLNSIIEVEESSSTDEKKKAIRTFKTCMKMIINSQSRSLQPFKPAYIQLLPFLCRLYPSTRRRSAVSCDEELDFDTRVCMSCIAQCLLSRDQLVDVSRKLQEISCSTWWHIRHCLLPYIQVISYINVFELKQCPEALDIIQDIVVSLLHDERFEVAKMAGATLSGLIQCGLIQVASRLLSLANSLCLSKLPKKRSNGKLTSATDSSSLLKRHAGVLILSSCILSSPYTVPTWMPDLIDKLSHHLNEPHPIHNTVKFTFSEFRRTHYDNWHEDKSKFAPDQLSTLTDLLVSPNYYA